MFDPSPTNSADAAPTPDPPGLLSGLALVALAFLAVHLPVVAVPLGWIEVFMHESSHALTALATGGTVLNLVLYADGSGYIRHAGGFGPLVAFAGYAGAPLSGLLLARATPRLAKPASCLLLLWIAACTLLWARDLTTWFILLVPTAVFGGVLRAGNAKGAGLAARFIGACIIAASITKPAIQLMGGTVGGIHMDSDADQLAAMTLIPQVVWVGLWELVCGWCLWRSVFRRAPHRADAKASR